MGRLLEIARAVPVVKIAGHEAATKQKRELDQTEYRTTRVSPKPLANELNEFGPPPKYSQPAADVLDIIVKTGVPVLHSQIVRDMAGRGHGKEAAREAIELCQLRRWIEHDLVDGYELAGE